MRFVVAGFAVFFASCGGFHFTLDTSESDARKIPIHAAAIDCRLEDLRKQLPTQRDARDSQGQTALHWAVVRGCSDGVSMLLDAGADPNHSSSSAWPLLLTASTLNDAGLVENLVRHGARLDSAGVGGATALHLAASSRNTSVVEYLLLQGADVRALDQTHRTPLHYGARHEVIVKTLIARGGDVNARAQDGRTPLVDAPFWPYFQGSSGVNGVRALLAAGADIRVRDENGYTPVMEAARRFDAESLQELLRAGGDINARANHGETALRIYRVEADRAGGSWANVLWSMVDSGVRRAAESRRKMEHVLIAARAAE